MAIILPVVAALAIVLILGLVAPWDRDTGGVGFYSAVMITGVTAFLYAFARGRRPLLVAALVGLFGLVVFVAGSYVAYESGWWGLDWNEFGDTDEPGEIVAWSLVWGGPLAA